jgi:hypothetical protein
MADFRNVLQRLLHFPNGSVDASSRLVIGSPRQDAHEFLEHVDRAVGEMAGKVEHCRSQDGMPTSGVKGAQMLRAHPHALGGEFVKDHGRNAIHQRRRQVQRPEKANALGNSVEVDGGWRQCRGSRPGKDGHACPLTQIEKLFQIELLAF